MDFRTDLALERREILGKQSVEGVDCTAEQRKGAIITRICVRTKQASEIIGKPCGTYVTVEVTPFSRQAQLMDSGGLTAVTEELKKLLPAEGTVLVAGLGNGHITPDAFGPRAAAMVLPTRHIGRELAQSAGLGNLRTVACFCPGVLGETGMEAAETLQGVVQAVKPRAVVVMDALAAVSPNRLGCTVQLSDTGIVPGSGVGNARSLIDESVLGVPVLSLGVPTVINAATLSGKEEQREMTVTPREIDLVIERASKLAALALNCALQPHLRPEDILILTA